MKRMKKLPEEELSKLINLAEASMSVPGGGNLTENVNKIENLAYNRGFKVDRKEVREKLVAKLAEETVKELKRQLAGA